MSKSVTDFPLLPGEASGKRAAEVVTDINGLNEIGKSAGQFSMHVGETISFDDDCVNSEGRPHCKKQAVGTEGNFAYYIACKRNGKPSWLSVSSLRRRDKDRNFICPWMENFNKVFQSSDFVNTYNELLKGKSIKGEAVKPTTVYKFGSETETETQNYVTIVNA